MFTSTPFPELPFSPNVFLPPSLVFDPEKDCVCFNYNHITGDPFISAGCFFHSPSPAMENNISTTKQDFVTHQQQSCEGPLIQSCEDHPDLLDAIASCSKSKKDGQGKIYTARGLRDRRVRLSIGISRKFFCLQDLLGFDKASKTLDWLFSKSKNAIKELVDETNHCSSSTVNDQLKADFLESFNGDSDEDKGKKKKMVMKCLDGKKKKMTRNLQRDQARAMARARARKRTREKINTKNILKETRQDTSF